MAGSETVLPSGREDFFHTTVFHITQPVQLPRAYSWLEPGCFGLYRGEVRYPGEHATRADWAWEIVYVNGHTDDGERSSLGYSLFLSLESEWFGRVAKLPMPPEGLPGEVRAERGLGRFTRGFPGSTQGQVPMALSLPVLFPCIFEQPKDATTTVETPLGSLPCFTLERHGLGFMRGTASYEAGRYILVGMDIVDGQKSVCSFRLSETNIRWR